MRARHFLILFSLLLTVSGCASRAERAMQKTPDYRAGYSDGCASASLQGANPREAGSNRDEEAYRTIPAYRLGFGQGYGACRQMAMPQSPGGLPR